MDSSKPGCHDRYASADRALDRALRLEIPENPRGPSLATSVALHAIVTLPLFFTGLRSLHEVDRPAPAEIVTQLFAPALSRPASPVRSPNPQPEESPQIVPETPESAASDVAVDLSAIQLSFPPDIRNQLPAVVAAQGGVLALLDKGNPAIARYIFRPPAWRAEEANMDVSGKLKLLMDPPREWPVFREVAATNGLNLDSYQACAMFDMSYRRCLQSAIRGRIPATFSGSISAARLIFNADRSCGVEVLDVSLAAANPSVAK